MTDISSRERIVKSARALFAAKGFGQTSPREVMDAARVGQGSFYHYFRSKRELGKEVLESIAADLLGVGKSQLETEASSKDRLKAYLYAHRDAKAGCRLGRMAYDEGLGDADLREPVTQYFREMETLLTEIFKAATTPNRKRTTPDPADLAACTLAVVQGGYVLARVHDDPAYLKQAIDGFWSLAATHIAAKSN